MPENNFLYSAQIRNVSKKKLLLLKNAGYFFSWKGECII